MNSDLPKVLHQIAGAPMLHHAMTSGAGLLPERTIIVAGHGADAVKAAALACDPGVAVVVQEEQLGTGHAVAMARDALNGFEGDAIILYGDTPFIRPETLDAMMEARAAGHAVVVLGFEAADPGRYGRLVMQGDSLARIVEFKDATEQERAISLCNSGVMAADARSLLDLVGAISTENASGEYYLTDIVALARARGLSATAVTCAEAETMGVNTRADLAEAEAAFQSRARARALENGVTIAAPETVFFAHDTVVGRDCIIEPHVFFGPGVTVDSGARICAFSYLENCRVGAFTVVGPHAHLSPGTPNFNS